MALGNENLTVPTAPVNFPPLWDTSWFDWVQYNASIRMPMVRNIGEALGVGAPVNLNEETGTTASQSGKPLFASTVNVQNLYHLEEQLGGKTELGGLQSPKMKDTGLWDPGPEAENLRNLGKALYVQSCQKCHLAPIEDLKKDLKNEENWFLETESGKRILHVKTFDLQEIGTDPNQAMNFYRRVAVFEGKTTSAAQGLFAVTEFIRRDNYVKLGVTDKEKILEYNRYRKFDEGTPDDVKAGKYIGEVLVANLRYKARPLDGIWATPPYLHNGSVPNLHQMLVPVECRDKSFYLGTTLYDKKHGGFVTEQFSFEVAFLRRVWAGGFPPFCGIGQNGGDKGDHSPNAEEGASRADHAGCTPTVQVVSQARLPEAASPTIGSSLRDRLPHASGQDVSLPCCRRVRTDARHRAQVSRFLGRRYWRRCDLLGQLRAQLLEMEARQGTFIFDIDQTYCSQQGKLTENTIIRGEKTKRPKKSKKKQKKYCAAVVSLFRDGLADYPQRNASAVFRELLHRGLLQGEEDRAPQADRTGRSTYPPVAFAPRSARGGPGRHRLRRRGHPHCLQGTQV